MGTTAQKLNRVLQTKSDLKTVINYSGANITNETTFKDYPKLLNKAYIDILNDEGESLYNALPKTTGTGTSIDLNTEKGKMKIELKGDTQQEGTPTPSNPQNVKVVTGEQNVEIVGKNLLYSNLTYPFTINGVTVTQEDDGSITLNGTQSGGAMHIIFNNAFFDDIKKYDGKEISISLTTSGQGSFSNFGIKNGTSTDLLVLWSPSLSKTQTLNLNNYTNIYFDIWFDNNSRTFVNYNIKPQVEVGNATTYEPYQSQNYPVNLGKNLFDKDNVNYFNAYVSVGSRKIIAEDNDRTIYIKCKPNTTYTIQKMVQETTDKNRFVVGTTSSIPQINDVMNDFHYYSGGTTNTTLTLTTGANANYLCVFCWSIDSVTTFEEMLDSIQIEVGSQATEYSPYFEPIEVCKIRDNQDYIYENDGNWFLHKEIGKVILNGGSNESYAYQNNHRFWLRRSYWTDETVPKNATPTSQTFGIYCNRFEEQSTSGTWNGIEGISYDGNNIVDLPIGGTLNIACNSIATTVNDFKTWLSNNPLEVGYILQNPQDIQITNAALIQQLDNLKNAKSYDDVTHIMQTKDGLPFNLEVSALAKIE